MADDDLRAVLDRWREFAHNYNMPCDTDAAFDECWDTLATALERLGTLRGEMADCHAILRAPSFDNDGGPTDLRDEIRTLLHNNTVFAEDAAEARQSLEAAEREHEAVGYVLTEEGEVMHFWPASETAIRLCKAYNEVAALAREHPGGQ